MVVANEDACTWSLAPDRNYGEEDYLALSHFIAPPPSIWRVADIYLKFPGVPKSYRISLETDQVNMKFHSREADVATELKPRFENGSLILRCFYFFTYDEVKEIKVGVYEVDPEEWKETEITFNNSPTGTKLLTYSFDAPPKGADIDLEVVIPLPYIERREVGKVIGVAIACGAIIGGICWWIESTTPP